MEVKQMIMMTIMLLMTGGMAYLIGDIHGFMRGMEKAWPLNLDKKNDK